MKKSPEKIQKIVPNHIQYWNSRKLEKYLGGPFADRSGGMISFETSSLEEATNIIMNDPFIKEKLLENKWVKEWLAE